MHDHRPTSSYNRHIECERSLAKRKQLPSSYLFPRSIDAWQQERMLNHVSVLLSNYPDATWITIGDGLCTDAYYLKSHHADVLATSLLTESLAYAKDQGLIDKYKAINAESINEPDESFDFVLCKHAYHHFPRPPIAFYEMLRISKRAVVLIEPHDSSRRLGRYVKRFIKRSIRGDLSDDFEVSGNYIYRVSTRELEKMMTALSYDTLAYRRFNHFYCPKLTGVEYTTFGVGTFLAKLGIIVQDILAWLKLLDYGLVCAIAIKEPPSDVLIAKLKRSKFTVVYLPRNPYAE